jgi:glycosyltransferase involved in cell wall biosynthesis
MLTVLITTYNGAPTLPDVLDAYRRLEPPAGGWKLVVVDNDSTDGTPDILASFRDRLPLHILHQRRRGQNAARNTGLPHVEGDLAVLSDDDAVPSPRWLASLRAAADAQPDFTIFAGPILPRWPSPPPRWLLDWVPLSPTFAVLPPAEEGAVPARRAFGPNVTLRTSVFADGRRFDESIGPKGHDYPMGAETEFLIRLGEEGARAWHCAGAVVHHIVREFQMSEAWVLERAVRFGRGQYRLEARSWTEEPVRILGRPRHLLWRVARQHLRVARARVGRRPDEAFRSRWFLRYLQGQMVEARLMMQRSAATAAVEAG